MEELASAYANQSTYHQNESQRNPADNVFNTYQSSYQLNANEGNLPSEEKMRRQLKFFFMNPFEKWHAKRRFPWKLLVQIIKIITVTAQLSMFASLRYDHVSYLWDTKVSFSHLFIKGWETSREINAYPPSNGPLALYRIDSFYDFVDFAVSTFSNIEDEAIGSYRYEYKDNSTHMPLFCFSEYVNRTIPRGSNSSYEDSSQRCLSIPPSILENGSEFKMKEFLKNESVDINFSLLMDAALSFFLHTTKLRRSEPFETTECYKLQATIFFNNRDHDGQMLVDMNVMATLIDCSDDLGALKNMKRNPLQLSLSILTIVICCLSFIMCLRALFNAQILKNTTIEFFKVHFNRDLTYWEKFEFNNLWYVLICINDMLIIVGSLIKIGLESEKESFDWSGDTSYQDQVNGFDYDGYLDKWNVCSLLLGLGNLFVWFGCLRYLGFFETYNVLILTIKTCFPNVLRYSICISMVFSGYSFCGWLVLGPYHLKFRSLSASIECLYSLVNGDDMFATFSALTGTDRLIWWFSRVYLYSFISLFIYVILSLFIAIIMDSYETIKGYYDKGFPCSSLRQFAHECNNEPHSGAFMDDHEATIPDILNSIFCCCCRRSRISNGYEAIPS